MKQNVFIILMLTCLSLFGAFVPNENKKLSENLAKNVVMGIMKLNFGKIDIKSRICKIVNGSAMSLDDGKLKDIGSGNDSPAVHYVYFNDMKELTNSSLSAWVSAAAPEIYVITNKVRYKQMKLLPKKQYELPSTIHTKQYYIKKGVLWEVSSFISAIEAEKKDRSRKNELPALEKKYGPFISTNAIANQIVNVNGMSAKAFKAKFAKLILYCRSKCLCQLSDYYNYCYKDSRKTHYSVEIKIDDEIFYGYVRKDSFFGKTVFNTLKDGKPHYMTFGISYPLSANENGGGSSEHVQIVLAFEFNYDKAFTKEDKTDGIQFATKIQRERIIDILYSYTTVNNLCESTLKKCIQSGIYPKYELEDIKEKLDMYEKGIKEYIDFFKLD